LVDLGGGAPSQHFARAAVEGDGDGLEVLVVPSAKVGAFGEVLAQQGVGKVVR